MAEEKQTPEIDDTLSRDDASVLRYVLGHTRGTAPVALYSQDETFDDDEVASFE